MKRIFIIDDETEFIKIAKRFLEKEGFRIASATDPASGLRQIQADPPDLLLLDIRLPGQDGFEVCRTIKAHPKICDLPIIMISVKADETNIVLGLEMGADDYVTKPFREMELLARVKAVLRRRGGIVSSREISCGPLKIDYAGYTASINDKPLVLTPKEFEVLAFLTRNEGRVVTRAALSDNVWGADINRSSRTLDIHVEQLRKKLAPNGHWIKSLKGIGFRFEVEDLD